MVDKMLFNSFIKCTMKNLVDKEKGRVTFLTPCGLVSGVVLHEESEDLIQTTNEGLVEGGAGVEISNNAVYFLKDVLIESPSGGEGIKLDGMILAAESILGFCYDNGENGEEILK